jgi:serine/threonine-protein kinase
VSPAPAIDQLRTLLGDVYAVEREVGRGGMATVYLARDLKHERDVAVKVLHPELGAVLGGERFLTEIRTTARLQHPNILPLIDSGAADGWLYYVMPFVEGESLRGRLAREHQLPIDDALQIAREVADALQYAHERGVIHRDVKPENILLQSGHALVSDFGIALAATRVGGERLTESGVSLGTPQYMAPEQAMGERELDGRVDVYALGSVVYEMLAGEPPFTGPSAQAIVARVLTADPPSLRARRATVPPFVDAAVATALQKLPADRFRTADAFGRALSPPATTTLVTTASPAAGSRGATARTAAIAGIAALAAAASAFVAGTRTARERTSPPVALGRQSHVTWGPELEVSPALSPDGASVAYAAGSLPTLRIMVKPVGEGRALPLTGDTSDVEFAPVWSPDGTRILFLSRGGAFSAPAGGGPPRAEVRADLRSPVTAATWSPDGRRLAFARGDTLFLRDADARVRAFAYLSLPSLCTWSPRGTFVACATGNPLYSAPTVAFGNLAPMRIALVRAGDGTVTYVTDAVHLNTSPAWSSDERWLYWVSDREGPRDVFAERIAEDGRVRGQPVRLTTGLDAHTISLAANGSRLAYARFEIRSSIWDMPLPRGDGIATTTGATRLTHANENIESFDVSRDGRWLVYDSDLTGRADIFRVPLSGGEPQRLTSDPTDHFNPSISADDGEVAFHAWTANGSRDLFVLRLDGSGVEQVTHSLHHEATPSWSPDGRALAFADFSTGPALWIVRRDSAGHWQHPIQRAIAGALPQWSPDGRSLVFLHRNATFSGDVDVVPVDSGQPRVLVEASAPGRPRPVGVTWGDDGLIYFEATDAHGNTTVWSVAPAGGAPRELLRFDPTLHPPNRGTLRVLRGRVYFLGELRESDVWTMEIGKGR